MSYPHHGFGSGFRVTLIKKARLFSQNTDGIDFETEIVLNHSLYSAAVHRTNDSIAILLGYPFRKLSTDFERLLIPVFRVNYVVLDDADVFGGNVSGVAISLDKIWSAER
jgi:hypothetical protein|tara:strand:+ start:152 stop:481 length:330 start_codon:yes stop_codon:yes gene_type:complete